MKAGRLNALSSALKDACMLACCLLCSANANHSAAQRWPSQVYKHLMYDVARGP